jgi:hypothetical protein
VERFATRIAIIADDLTSDGDGDGAGSVPPSAPLLRSRRSERRTGVTSGSWPGLTAAVCWWAPYSAGRPHLLYSLTKSFTSIAVGLAIADGRLSLDNRVVEVFPDHVPADISEQGHRITVHHLLSMTAGHSTTASPRPGDSNRTTW